MKKPLHILVTRPVPQGKGLCEKIESQGDEATYFPTLVYEDASPEALQDSIHRVKEQDGLIFISVKAATVFFKFIHSVERAVFLAAVGETTAKTVQAVIHRPVSYPAHEAGSEALLTLDEFNQVSGKKIMLVRGEGGRTVLADTLTKQGAHVSHFIAYKRILPSVEVQPLIQKIKKHPLDVILITSGESLENLKSMLSEAYFPLIKHTSLIVMSDRIKILAHELGFETVFVVQQASLLAFIEEKRNVLCKMK